LLSLSWSYPVSDDRVIIMNSRIGNDTQLTSTLIIESAALSDSGMYICNASTQALFGLVAYSLTVGKFVTLLCDC